MGLLRSMVTPKSTVQCAPKFDSLTHQIPIDRQSDVTNVTSEFRVTTDFGVAQTIGL